MKAKRGSLIGLYSGLLRSRDEYNIVVACDMPFLNPGLLSYMAGLHAGYDAVVPQKRRIHRTAARGIRQGPAARDRGQHQAR